MPTVGGIPTPLVLLPGLDGTGELFEPLIAAAGLAVATVPVAYPSDLASYEELEPWAQDKLADDCVILAESFSGPLGARLAKDPRVRALILCNSFVTPPRWSQLRHLARAPMFALPPPAWLVRWLLVGNAAPAALVTKVQQVIRQVPASVLARRLREVLSCDERGALAELAKPILYLRGTSDALVPDRSCQEIRSLCPDAQVADLAGPHLLLQVEPAGCWEAILPLLR